MSAALSAPGRKVIVTLGMETIRRQRSQSGILDLEFNQVTANGERSHLD